MNIVKMNVSFMHPKEWCDEYCMWDGRFYNDVEVNLWNILLVENIEFHGHKIYVVHFSGLKVFTAEDPFMLESDEE